MNECARPARVAAGEALRIANALALAGVGAGEGAGGSLGPLGEARTGFRLVPTGWRWAGPGPTQAEAREALGLSESDLAALHVRARNRRAAAVREHLVLHYGDPPRFTVLMFWLSRALGRDRARSAMQLALMNAWKKRCRW